MSKDKIVDRIKKLLSLSKSTNEHEAANAAAQAADLMLRHEIEEAELEEVDSEETEEVEEMSIDESKQRINWKGYLKVGLCISQGCFSYTDRLRKADGSLVCSYKIVGQPSKLATIKYMYQYLVAEIDRLADIAYRMEHIECKKSKVPAPSARAWKNAFRLGAAGTVQVRLIAQREKTLGKAKLEGKSQALVVVKRAEDAVSAFVALHHPDLRKLPRASFSSRSGMAAGQEAGKGISLGGQGARLGAGARMLGSGK